MEEDRRKKKGKSGMKAVDKLALGVEIKEVRLPIALRRFWIGVEKMGEVDIVWV